MKQRDKMRELYRLHRGDIERCVADYALAEASGKVPRGSNDYSLDAHQYARRLFQDGARKGWIEE